MKYKPVCKLFNVILILSLFCLPITTSAFDKPRIQAKPAKPVIEIEKTGKIRPESSSDCVVDTDCPRGKICNGVKHCVDGCRKNTDCGKDNYCSDEFKCVPCLINAHCRDGKVCDQLSNQCVECTKDNDCSYNQKCDTSEKKCVPK